MAGIHTTILIDLSYSGLVIPQRTIVQAGTIVSFKLNRKKEEFNYSEMPFNGATVELYFDRKSPFDFNTGLLFRHRINEQESMILAENSADKPGDYKYGVRVVERGITRYDEDPFLIVFP